MLEQRKESLSRIWVSGSFVLWLKLGAYGRIEAVWKRNLVAAKRGIAVRKEKQRKRESQQNKSDKLTAKAYHRIAEDTER
nr:hypothetical protein [uncultured Stomatobaculum sp.]